MITAALGFLKLVPRQVWYALAAIAALTALFFWIDGRGYDRGQARERATWQAREAKLVAAAAARLEAAQKALLARDAAQIIAEAAAAAERAMAAAKHARDLAALQRKVPTYVTRVQADRCTDVPRGYLLLRRDAAAFANGAADGLAAPAPAAPDDSPSGVSLAPVAGEPASGTYLADTDVAQAAAFRSLAQRLKDTDVWAESVLTWCNVTITTLKGVSP